MVPGIPPDPAGIKPDPDGDIPEPTTFVPDGIMPAGVVVGVIPVTGY